MDAGAVLMLGGAVVLTVLPAVSMVIVYLFRRLESQERLKAIEHGHVLAFDAWEIALRTRRSGIVCLAAGAGIMAAAVIAANTLKDGDLLAGVGLGVVPLFIGAGLLADYRLQLRQVRKDGQRCTSK